jgi:hypothetical protein
MFWIGIIVGLFIGANVGFVMSGMLFLSRKRDEAQMVIANKHTGCLLSVIDEKIVQGSQDQRNIPAPFQNEYPDETVS